MVKNFIFIYLLTLFIYSCNDSIVKTDTENAPDQNQASSINWKPFNKSVFEEAKKENKLVLLDIGANWCHWCHVMDDSTYSDLKVQQLLNENFILSREDQDSRADLFSKYRAFGWPAIIVFNADGDELLKLKGYQHRTKFISSLQSVIDNPVAMLEKKNELIFKSDSSSSSSSDLISTFNNLIDHKKGSLKTTKKSLNKEILDLAFDFGNESDSLKKWVSLSVKNSYNLLDPVWGGIYQYSTHSDWHNQHFEKILRVQADYMQIYIRYGFLFSDSSAIRSAEKIYDYCNRFLSDNAPLFDNSQDADYKKGVESTAYYSLSEKERLKLGIPAVNHKQFLKENAMMTVSLAQLWCVTGNKKYLVRAEKTLAYLIENFNQPNGLYSRSAEDNFIYSLEDNTAMLEALTLAYQISGDKKYIVKADSLTKTILNNFLNDDGVLFSSCGDLVVESSVLPNSNYNAAFAINHVGNILDSETLRLASKSITHKIYRNYFDSSEYLIPYILSARKQFDLDPFHAVWITDKFDTDLELSFIQKIILNSGNTIVIDRVDLKNLTAEQELLYGSSEANTLFLCTSSFCSSPITTVEQLDEFYKSQTDVVEPEFEQ